MIHSVMTTMRHQLCLSDKEIYKSVNFDDYHHPFRLKPESENLNYRPRAPKFQSFNKFPEFFDTPNTGTV